MNTNSLLGPIDELQFGTYQPTDVEAAFDSTEALAWERLNAVLALPADQRNFDNTVLAITRATDEFDSVASLVSHLESVLGEPWRDASNVAAERSAKLASDVYFHKGLYDALVSLRDKSDYVAGLSAPRQRLLREFILEYERAGVNLPEETVARLRELRSDLSRTTTQFGQNVVTANDTSGIELSDAAALAGLPEAFIKSCEEAAKELGKTGFWVGYSQPNAVKIMTECSVRSTRQAYEHMAITRATTLNEALTKEILKLRREMANLLGYANYADYILADRMAKTGTTARTFIDRLTARYRALADQQRDELEAFARKFDNDPKLTLDTSDLDTGMDYYYASKLREQEVGLDEAKLQEYLPMEAVIGQMFATLSKLYGVTFKPVDLPKWHDDVQPFEIRDADGHHLATVWCDWFARKGKHPGAWMNQHYVADRGDDSYAKPHLGYVCANFESPSNGRPSLLTIRDVETIWHEFGHFMHLALNKTELREQSMMSCQWDFVEAPSQIMENWIWQPEILDGMAKHYKTGESLPEDITTKLIAGRTFRVAAKAMRQLGHSTEDLALHIDYDPTGDVSVSDFALPIKQQFLPVPVYPDDTSMTTFSHIFAGGYAAAYYSYKWAEAIEADLFTRFAAEGITSAEVGAAYRDKVLARGDEAEPAELIGAFLGRSSNEEAMLKRDGVAD